MRPGPALATATLVTTAALALSAAAGAATTVRLNGVGPLALGMDRSAAVATGWLSNRGTGCPLGGDPPVTYRLSGAKAPDGLRGVATFDGGRLTNLSFTRGARTSAGVTVRKTRTKRMTARYRKLGFRATAGFDGVFGGTFATVTKNGAAVVGAFAERRTVTVLAIPQVLTCD